MTDTALNSGAFYRNDSVNSGTGNYSTFLRVEASPTEQGYNTDNTSSTGPLDDKTGSWTHSIQLGALQIVTIGGVDYYDIRLDLNETNAQGGPAITLTHFDLYTSSAAANATDITSGGVVAGSGFTNVFTLASPLALIDFSSGSGTDDGGIFIPVSDFGGAPDTQFVTLYASFSNTDGGFEEFRALTQPFVPVTPEADIAVFKSYTTTPSDPSDPTGGIGVIDHAGQEIDYTIAFQNTGNVALSNINVTDALPGATTPTSILGDGSAGHGDTSHNTGDVNNNGLLDPGETWSYSSRYFVLQSDIDSNGNGFIVGDLSNFATVTGDPPVNSGLPQASGTAEADTPIDQDPALTILKTITSITDTNSDGLKDAGDVVHYDVLVTNTGNQTLTNLSVVDPLTGGTLATGQTLAPGATLDFTPSYTLLQSDVDNNGNPAGTGEVTNTATADSDQTDPQDSSVSNPVDYAPNLSIVKTITSITDTNGDGLKDAGDVVNYDVLVTNTGDVTLTGVSVVDPLTGGTLTSGATLAPGATLDFTPSYTLLQSDVDNNGNPAGTGKVTNTATADSDQTAPKDSSASNPVDYKPAIQIVKTIDGVQNADHSPDSDGKVDSVGDIIDLRFAVTNTGDVTLNNPTSGISDNPALNAGSLAYVSGDNGNGLLDLGETWIYTAAHSVTQADLDASVGTGGRIYDTVTVVDTTHNSAQDIVTDDDTASTGVVLMPGPGVRTPGFWINNGSLLWDGNTSTFPKAGGLHITTTDLLYKVDVNGDGVVNGSDNQGTGYLLLGDWNKDGVTDNGEHTLLVSRTDALSLLNASLKQQQDGRWVLSRDMVATWLNYLAGNGVGPQDANGIPIVPPAVGGDSNSPGHYLDDAILWMTLETPTNPTTHLLSLGSTHTVMPGAAVPTSSPLWNSLVGSLDHTAANMHVSLDGYNNTGMIGGHIYAPLPSI